MSHSMELMLGPITNVALQITIRRPEAGDFNAGLLPVQSDSKNLRRVSGDSNASSITAIIVRDAGTS